MNPHYQIQHGDIILVNCDPSIGAEIRKIRPCVVVQGKRLNEISALVTIIPITSRAENPFFADISIKRDAENNLHSDGVVRTSQIFTYDRSRFFKLIGKCSPELLLRLKKQVIFNLELDSR